MIAATPAEQHRLLDLQHIDTAIRQLEHRRANLDEQRALDDNATTLQRVTAEHATTADRLQRLGVQQQRHEREIAAVDARRRSEEGRMYSGEIRTDKQLGAVKDELSALRSRKNELEDALLEIMEQIEELDSLSTTLRARREELTAGVDTLTTARDEAATGIDAELVERRAERGALAADLNGEILDYYAELARRKDGVAVAALQRRTCAGCRLELTAIELEDVRAAANSHLARCEQCGRILVVT